MEFTNAVLGDINKAIENVWRAFYTYRKTSLKERADFLRTICSRIILNKVPTDVEVCKSMHHGGPFPATTDSRFTSVGADGIKRFARPLSFQNWPDELLPDELKNDNPNKIWRITNNKLSQTSI